MVLKSTYWIPHGDELIDLPDRESRIMRQKITEATSQDRSDVKVVISPHGIGLTKNIGVIMTENLRGSYRIQSGLLSARYVNDRKLAREILDAFPDLTEAVSFGTGSGPASVFPVDFGTIIPLKFFKHSNLVMIGQPRLDRRNDLILFGKALRSIVDMYERTVSVIFSADMAHTHSADGPYGYSEDSARYDDLVQDIFRRQKFSECYGISEQMIKNARPDSFWNLLIMWGFLSNGGISMKMEYYYVAHYFGMLFAHS